MMPRAFGVNVGAGIRSTPPSVSRLSSPTASLAALAAFRADPIWLDAWDAVPAELADWLKSKRLHSPDAWAHIFPPDMDPEQGRDRLLRAFRWAGEGGGLVQVHVHLARLHDAARTSSRPHASRVAGISDTQASVDRDLVAKTRMDAQVFENL